MTSSFIYLASIALEPERWSSRRPSFAFSEWCPAAREAGFDGIELWEYHYTLAAGGERELLERALGGAEAAGKPPDARTPDLQSPGPQSPDVHSTAAQSPAAQPADAQPAPQPAARQSPARWRAPPIFNTYALPTRGDRHRWRESISLATTLAAAGIKFNLGADPARAGEHRDVLLETLSSLPERIELLCECHPGTIVERPEEAARFFESPELEAVRFIIHPFLIGPAKLRRWFDALPGRLAHAHSQMRDRDNRMLPLASRPEYVAGQIGILRELGYTGSFSIEFVEGTGTGRDLPSHTFAAAVNDMSTLRALLSEAE